MSEQVVRSSVGQRTVPDYLRLVAYVLYAVAGAVFIIGLYVDVVYPDMVVVSAFTIYQDPANSGLFISATIILVIGYVTSKIGQYIQERRIEEVDQTQEWTVDIGSNE